MATTNGESDDSTAQHGSSSAEVGKPGTAHHEDPLPGVSPGWGRGPDEASDGESSDPSGDDTEG